MSRPRNTQRAAAARAQAILAEHPGNARFPDLTALTEYVERVARSQVFERQLRRAGVSGDLEIQVGDGRGRRSSTLYSSEDGAFVLELPKAFRSQAWVCVLLPWVIADTRRELALDGPAMVSLRLSLVQEFMAPAAAHAFRTALEEEQVRFDLESWAGDGDAYVGAVSQKVVRKPRTRGPYLSCRPRDSQRARLYRAERDLSVWNVAHMDSLEAVEAYVRGIECTLPWDVLRRNLPRVKVRDGRGSPHSRAHRSGEIHVVREHRFPLVILHELAHLVTSSSYAAHGPEFTAYYGTLINEYLGEVIAQEFEASCARYSVEICSSTLETCREWFEQAREGLVAIT